VAAGVAAAARLPWGFAGYGFALVAIVACVLALASVTLMVLRRTRPAGRRGLLGLVLLLIGFYATWAIGERSGVRAANREANRETIPAVEPR
jgi:membrane-bound ClpP family serine protease